MLHLNEVRRSSLFTMIVLSPVVCLKISHLLCGLDMSLTVDSGDHTMCSYIL